MGVRTLISIDEVNNILQKYGFCFEKLEHTINGISDTTYIAIDKNNTKFILKIYEFATIEIVKNEIILLNSLKELPVPKYLLSNEKIELYQNKPIGLYTYLEGKSVDYPSINQIEQIGYFLGSFHNQTTNLYSINSNLYTHKRLKQIIKSFESVISDKLIIDDFLKKYNLVSNLKIEDKCIIHGDLFPDNAKFMKNRLSGVFDFIESCIGDPFFDLSVVANSWCFEANNLLNIEYINILINSYNKISKNKVKSKIIKEYMLFASLFYAAQRFYTKYIEKRNVNVKDYKEYIIKFENIYKQL